MESIQAARPQSPHVYDISRIGEPSYACDADTRRGASYYAERTAAALVIDSDALMRLAVSEILQRDLKFEEVLAVDSLERALALGAARTSLILVDASLLGRSPVCDIVRIQDDVQRPIVLLADDCGDQRAMRWIDEGVAAVLDRRIDHSGFRKAIERVQQGERFCSVTSVASQARWANADTLESRARGLRPRQREILRMIADGCRNRDIARALGLCEPTVKAHIQAIFAVLCVVNRTRAAICANWLIKEGLL